MRHRRRRLARARRKAPSPIVFRAFPNALSWFRHLERIKNETRLMRRARKTGREIRFRS